MARPSPNRNNPIADRESLERLALAYVGRYATTRAKLAGYLSRKLRERGWDGEGPAPVEAVVERMAELRYVDDQAFATARGAALTRRGFGPARISLALRAAGISGDDAAEARRTAAQQAKAAAIAFARRRRLGPFHSGGVLDAATRNRAMAAMLRAGHAPEIAREIIFCPDPGRFNDGVD